MSVARAVAATSAVARVAYPSVVDCASPAGCQVERLVDIVFDDLDQPTVLPVQTFSAEDSGGSVLQATIVETDRADLDKANLTDAGVVYWIETTGAGASLRLFARYSQGSELVWSQASDLSVVGGRRLTWAPKLASGSNAFAGDYMKGAFFYRDGKLNFLCQWPESDPTITPPNLLTHWTVVTMSVSPPALPSTPERRTSPSQ